jgi:hypothetical protein
MAARVQEPTPVKLPLCVPAVKLTVPVGVDALPAVSPTVAVHDVACPMATVAGEQVRLRAVGRAVTVITAWALLTACPLSPL